MFSLEPVTFHVQKMNLDSSFPNFRWCKNLDEWCRIARKTIAPLKDPVALRKQMEYVSGNELSDEKAVRSSITAISDISLCRKVSVTGI